MTDDLTASIPRAVARPAGMTPVSVGERIEVIDMLRGFAILGILVVNLFHYANPLLYFASGLDRFPGTADRIVEEVIDFFCAGKFYSLFSLLFGVGLALQMQRADARGVRFERLYTRRLIVLLGIGVCHVVLLWAGDILIAYALLGFVPLLLCRKKLRTIIICAVIAHLIPVFNVSVLTVLRGAEPRPVARTVAIVGETPPKATADEEGFNPREYLRAWALQGYEVHGHGTYGQVLRYRLWDYVINFAFLIFFTGGSILGMFLFGLYVGRRGILRDVPGQRGFIRRVLWWGLVLGIAGNVLQMAIDARFDGQRPGWCNIVRFVGSGVGDPALCMFYASGLVLLAQRGAWHRLLRPLAPVGRMALTNYLLQSLICTTVFNSYGLGWFGQVGYARGLLLTGTIFITQILLSGWWLQRFRFGPVEWVWRSLTYGRRPAMRRG